MVYRATENTEARKAQSRDKLLEAGFNLVLEGGFNNITISKVAQRSNVATGTVYRYFTSKSELCEEIFLKATTTELEKVANTCQTPNKDPKAAMQQVLSEFAQRAIKGRRIAYALIAEPVDSMLDETRLQYRKAYANQFSQLIQKGITANLFLDQDPNLAATAIVGAMSEALIGPLSPENANPIENQKLTETIVSFCMRALVK